MRAKIRYFLIGFSLFDLLFRWGKRLLHSPLLYFYLLVVFFLFFRAYLPMADIERHAELLERTNPIEGNARSDDLQDVGTESYALSDKIMTTGVGKPMENSQYINETALVQAGTDNELSATTQTGKDTLSRDDGLSETRRAFGNTSGKGYTIDEFNQLTEDELTDFKGVGEVTAAAIVELRTLRGGFESFDELLDVKGIGPAKLKKILGGE